MPEPRERIARALSHLQGHPADIRFEGKPMWQSYLPEADAALTAVDIDPLIALLRQIETHAAGENSRYQNLPQNGDRHELLATPPTLLSSRAVRSWPTLTKKAAGDRSIRLKELDLLQNEPPSGRR